MTNDSTPEPIKRIAQALISNGSHGVAAREAKKETERNDARVAIYSELSRWVGEPVEEGDQIPIYRDGKRLGSFPATILSTGREVEQIVEASKLLRTSELRKQLKSLENLANLSNELLRDLVDLGPIDLLKLEGAPKKRTSDTETNVIRAIGTAPSTVIALGDMQSAFRWQIKELEKKLATPASKRGRPKNEAAHGVALGLAKLYARVCGKRPTYSEGPNGLSGDYTPALRSVFDKLGWQKLSLKSPAEAAIAQISDDDLETKLNALRGGLFSYPKN